MASVEFLRPRLRGARFADGAIPLEIFADLIALREMVIEVAGWRYLQEHPDRQRLPRGFAGSVDLKLTGVAEGSAIPIIALTPAASVLNGAEPPYRQIFEMARGDIAKTIGAAGQDGYAATANGQMPGRFLAYFNRIGRSLRDGECLELPTTEGAEPARLTPETRERLLRLSTIPELTREITVRGAISEADQDRMTFELQPVYGRKISGAMPEQHRATIVEAFRGYRDNVRVLVRGTGRHDRQRRLAGLESVEHITLLDLLDVPARLDEFRAMRDGWLDGEGLAPSHAGLDWLAASFERYHPDDVPLPYTYPMPDGRIEMEWPLGRHSVSLEINLATHRGDWLSFDKHSDDDGDITRDLDLDDGNDWEWLEGEIRRLSQEAK